MKHEVTLIAVIIISVDHEVNVVRVILQSIEDLVPGRVVAPKGQVPVSRAPARLHKTLKL